MKFISIIALLISANISFAAVDFNLKVDDAVPGEYVVKLNAKMASLKMADVGRALNAEVIKPLSKASNSILVKRSVSEKAFHAVANLEANPMVEYAEPNYIYKVTSLPNDPKLSKLWGLINEGQEDPTGRIGVAGYDVNAKKAWDLTKGSKDVVVAVIDTGVDPEIADLKNNMWVNEAELNGEEGVDDDGNGYVDDIHGYDFVNDDGDPTDDHSHGSHVAGTIAAEGNNGTDIVGVAWQARIMGIKFLSASGSGSLADAVLAIDYATEMGAHLSNNSWGGGGFSDTMSEAIQRAQDAGSMFIAAAGNSNVDNDQKPHYPSSYEHENVVAVAAINNSGDRASFSCWGKSSVDLGAPGRNILSTTPSGLKSYSGTSMATPHVAGAVALLLSHEPNLSVSDVKERLLTTSRPVASMRGKTVSGGILDAYALLTNTIPPPDPNDPNNWDGSMEHNISTAHPYESETEEVYEIEVPNAKRFALYFDKFELENGYDKLTLKDANGDVIATMTGTHNKSYSPIIDGSKVTLVFTSDNIVNKYGFDLTKIAFE